MKPVARMRDCSFRPLSKPGRPFARRRQSGKCRDRAASGDNHGYLALNKVGRQRRESLELIIRPTVFHLNVLANDKAGIFQALTPPVPRYAKRSGIWLRRYPITGIAGCCARAASGHAAAAPPRSVITLLLCRGRDAHY
jgi:hypothetical protein